MINPIQPCCSLLTCGLCYGLAVGPVPCILMSEIFPQAHTASKDQNGNQYEFYNILRP